MGVPIVQLCGRGHSSTCAEASANHWSKKEKIKRERGVLSQDRLQARLRSRTDKGVTRRASVLLPRRFVLSRLGQAGYVADIVAGEVWPW